MGFFIRYFDHAEVLQDQEGVFQFFNDVVKLDEKDMSTLTRKFPNQKGSKFRVYLDTNRYIQVAKTDCATLEEYTTVSGVEIIPTTKKIVVQNNEKAEVVKEEKPVAVERKSRIRIKAVPRDLFEQQIPDYDSVVSGWTSYAINYILQDEEDRMEFCLKAKVQDASYRNAHQMMCTFLYDKYGDRCLLPMVESSAFRKIYD